MEFIDRSSVIIEWLPYLHGMIRGIKKSVFYIPYNDLYGVGIVAMIKAIDKFDPNWKPCCGIKKYLAFCVRSAIWKFVKRHGFEYRFKNLTDKHWRYLEEESKIPSYERTWNKR